MRFLVAVFAMALIAVALPLLSAQDEERATPSPAAHKSATPKKKKSPAKERPKPSETPAAKKKRSAQSGEETTPKPGKKKKAKTSASASATKKRKKVKRSPSPAKSPSPTRTVLPAKSPSPTRTASPEKSPSPVEKRESATTVPSPTPPQPFVRESNVGPGNVPQVNVEKSGLLAEQGYEPPPATPAPRRRWWFWSRPAITYNYLSRSVREEIDRAPVLRRRWQFIVVHNSGTRQGNARIFDYYHRHVRRMPNGLAYHFVIGNGTSSGDGEIEVGDRWRRQLQGGHVHSDYLNNIALGICLVGDFNRDQPTPRQLGACEELIDYLRKRCGKIDGHYVIVRPHRDINPPQWPTDCPGDAFPYSWFRRFD